MYSLGRNASWLLMCLDVFGVSLVCCYPNLRESVVCFCCWLLSCVIHYALIDHCLTLEEILEHKNLGFWCCLPSLFLF